MDVILKEVEAQEVGEHVKISGDSTNRKVPNKLPIRAASLVNQATQHSSRSIRCVYCNNSHYSAYCVKMVDTNTGKQILKRDHRCFTCLSKDHIADKCDLGRIALGVAMGGTINQFVRL